MDKVTIIPRESKKGEIFCRTVRDLSSNDFFAEHLAATREYMKLNGISVSGKRYTDVGNVLLKGALVLEESVIDAVYLPIYLDERQYNFLLPHIDKIEKENKMIAVHSIYKDSNNKYSFKVFSASSSYDQEYEKLRKLAGLKYLTYAVNCNRYINEKCVDTSDDKGKTK